MDNVVFGHRKVPRNLLFLPSQILLPPDFLVLCGLLLPHFLYQVPLQSLQQVFPTSWDLYKL